MHPVPRYGLIVVGMGSDDLFMGAVPTACTLPAAQQPLRGAEFDELFRTSVQQVHRTGPTQLVLTLAPAAGRVEAVQDLTRRETACCPFFTFVLTGADPLRLEATVPPMHVEVLDTVAERAIRVTGSTA